MMAHAQSLPINCVLVRVTIIAAPQLSEYPAPAVMGLNGYVSSALALHALLLSDVIGGMPVGAVRSPPEWVMF